MSMFSRRKPHPQAPSLHALFNARPVVFFRVVGQKGEPWKMRRILGRRNGLLELGRWERIPGLPRGGWVTSTWYSEDEIELRPYEAQEETTR
jgi:hypothetical protein